MNITNVALANKLPRICYATRRDHAPPELCLACLSHTPQPVSFTTCVGFDRSSCLANVSETKLVGVFRCCENRIYVSRDRHWVEQFFDSPHHS